MLRAAEAGVHEKPTDSTCPEVWSVRYRLHICLYELQLGLRQCIAENTNMVLAINVSELHHCAIMQFALFLLRGSRNYS
jgi:hypothetical protein